MKRERYLLEETAEVVVGSKKIKFMVHVDLISERSKFFKAACSSAWQNNKKPIDLADTDPQVFSDYLQLLYGRKMEDDDDAEETFLKLVHVHTFAHGLGDLQSTNEAIDKIIKYSDDNEQLPETACINLVMRLCHETSPLKRLMVDYYVHEAGLENFDSSKGGLSVEFLKAVTMEFIRFRTEESDTILTSGRPTCHYHQHDDSCPKCGQGDKE